MNDATVPELTIVVPAYNEADRLPQTLADIDEFITASGICVELIVADDGSDDGTAVIARQFTPKAGRYRVLSLPHRGKAATVRDAMLAASGHYVMFTDADLSTPMDYTNALLARLRADADVAIGSREGVDARRIDEPFYRHLMGRLFNAFVRVLAVPGIADTQCGFKAFRREVARDLFTSLKVHESDAPIRGPRVTGFDVEVLFIARRRGYQIAEVPVYWKHVSGSKVDPVRDSFRMLSDVLRVRWYAFRGAYDVRRERA